MDLKKLSHHLLFVFSFVSSSAGLFSCVSEISFSERTPILLSASSGIDEAVLTRAATDIQGSSFQDGAKINAYITSNHNDVIGNPAYTDGRTVYTAKAPENGINELLPDVQPYFPNDYDNGDDVKVDIYALYPGGSGDDAVTSATSSFSIKADQTSDENYKMSDLMFAKVTDHGKTDGTANLHFTHKMAKLVVSASGEDGLTINGITLTNFNRTAAFAPATGVLGEQSDPGDIVVANGGAALVLPQTLSNKDFIKVATSGGDAIFWLDEKEFKAGKEYHVNLVVGSRNLGDDGKATITGWTDEIGTISVAAKGSTGFAIEDVSSHVYTGDFIDSDDVSVVVKSGTKVLTKDTDYTLQFFDNKNVGMASVLAVGAGTYTGIAAVKSFNITQATGSLSYATSSMTVDYTIGGTVSNTLTIVGDGTMTYSSSNESVATVNSDGDVFIVGVGSTTISAHMAGDHNYTAADASFTLTVNGKTPSQLTITLSGTSFTYTGQQIKPTVTVKDGSTTLEENTHYTLNWANNVHVGTATVTINLNATGYSGNEDRTFTITQATNGITMVTTDAAIIIGSTMTRTAQVLFGTPTYSVESGSSYVTLNTSTGQVTGVAQGTAVIKASVGGTDDYTGVSATYTVRVVPSSETEISYSGSVYTYTVPYTGNYKLEVWGAAGGNYTGNTSTEGGKGGYAYGFVSLTAGQNLYVCVGGKGEDTTDSNGTSVSVKAGGYNGGGNGGTSTNYYHPPAGGGATHIAKTTNRGTLANYSNNRSEVLIVAGGGGGGSWGAGGGDGGGEEGDSGNLALDEQATPPAGGTQTTGYAFGQGQNGGNGLSSGSLVSGTNIYQRACGGGGGGWYGGYAIQKSEYHTESCGSGAGGSGYIGGVISGDMETGVREGNGQAKITLVAE